MFEKDLLVQIRFLSFEDLEISIIECEVIYALYLSRLIENQFY